MNILIIGVGAIGGWLAGALQHEKVTLLARGESLRVLQKEGLTLLENGISRKLSFSLVTSTTAEFDVIIVATKTQHTAAALAGVKITPQTKVVYAQNGLPPWFMGQETQGVPVAGVVHGSTSRVKPGVVEIHKTEKIILGSPMACDLSPLADALIKGGINAEISTNIRLAIWSKLWGNMSMNPLSALTRLSSQPLMGLPQTRSLLESMMQEHVTLGEKLGLNMPISVQERLAMAQKLGDFKTSSLRDVERGLPIEIEGLLGDLLRLAEAQKIEMPVSRMIYNACLGLNLSLERM